MAPLRAGPIVSPRRLDPRPFDTTRPADIVAQEPAGERATEADRIARWEGVGWSTSTTFEDADGRPCFLVERELRLDRTALRWNHIVLAVLVVELIGSVSLGLDLSSRGLPLWEGTVGIALGAAGAVGFVGRLPVVEFVGTVALVRFSRRAPNGSVASGGSASSAAPREFEVWGVYARSRNWEVLGDRGGRRILQSAPLPDAVPILAALAGALSGGPSTGGGPNPSAGIP
ncbi:MAG: hypothetical protein L3K16_05910 [Thermoplasmata archaeon]|nr:hypothetical protein [Thermoplasmata archaeon]